MERIYGVRNGSAISTRGSNGTSGKSDMTQQELAERLGIDINTLKRAKALASLPLEILELVDKGTISPSTASRLIARLSLENLIIIFKKRHTHRKQVTNNPGFYDANILLI